ncbi:MAG: hypothetical protein Q7R56_01085, partial [Nanoarchaeota archaeon]|nr:hypothetical protein [Nanoarchaeota archaeon]
SSGFFLCLSIVGNMGLIKRIDALEKLLEGKVVVPQQGVPPQLSSAGPSPAEQYVKVALGEDFLNSLWITSDASINRALYYLNKAYALEKDNAFICFSLARVLAAQLIVREFSSDHFFEYFGASHEFAKEWETHVFPFLKNGFEYFDQKKVKQFPFRRYGNLDVNHGESLEGNMTLLSVYCHCLLSQKGFDDNMIQGWINGPVNPSDLYCFVGEASVLNALLRKKMKFTRRPESFFRSQECYHALGYFKRSLLSDPKSTASLQVRWLEDEKECCEKIKSVFESAKDYRGPYTCLTYFYPFAYCA